MADHNIYAALRVLVVEDELLIGALLEDIITELGATVLGPFASLPDALAAAALDNFNVALVDMNLCGEPADAVTRLLAQRAIPFALVSGSPKGDGSLGETLMLQKPFGLNDIERVLQRLGSVRESRPAQAPDLRARPAA